MKAYFRIMLGAKNVYAKECRDGSFIGADFSVDQDLSDKLQESWQDFNREFRPLWLEKNPGKSRIAAGLGCRVVYIVSKVILEGDVVLCPNGDGGYLVGEVTEPYSYHRGSIIPHRRTVRWFPETLQRNDMSMSLRNSTGSIGAVSNVTKYSEELEQLISTIALP